MRENESIYIYTTDVGGDIRRAQKNKGCLLCRGGGGTYKEERLTVRMRNKYIVGGRYLTQMRGARHE